jgi:hypothetical protein
MFQKQESLFDDMKPPEERIIIKIPAHLKRRFEEALAARGQNKKFVLMKAIEDYIKDTKTLESVV